MAVTCFLGKQGIAFRGHDERDESHNRGNFLECMSLLTKFDHAAPSNTTYLSSDSENEMIECCSQEVTENITEQLAFVFLAQFDAASITAAIENQLAKKGIDHLKCVAQTYDGAAVMSGDVGGVQAHLKKKKKSILRQFMHMS